MKASDLMKMPVIGFRDGSRLGKVRDFTFSVHDYRIQSLTVSGEKGQSEVPFEEVLEIGPDAIIVPAAGVSDHTGRTAPTGDQYTFEQLTGSPVAGSDGSYQGDVSDMEFDKSDGNLIALRVKRGGVLGIGAESIEFPRAALSGIGERLVTVQVPNPTSVDAHS